jgi:hypothetical protein
MLAFRDLAPVILRQRLVIEGYPAFTITDTDISTYLTELSDVTGMAALNAPVTHLSDLYGWAGWIHWEASGAHFYAWQQPIRFFSVDMYTCKSFEPAQVISFTENFFQATEIVAKEF